MTQVRPAPVEGPAPVPAGLGTEPVDLAGARAALADRGVRIVLGTAVDMSGVTRAKAVPLDRLEAFVRNGMGASPSWNVFCVDFGIAFTPELGVTGDLRLRIDPARLTVVDDGVAWAPARFGGQDGEPFAGCARSRLARVVDQVRAAGLRPLTGAELEFVLVEPDGSARRRGAWQGYGVRTALEVAPFLTEVQARFADAGLPLEQLHAEYGADQFELSIGPADPLLTADRTVLARIVVGRAAARYGLGVSFSPVPFAGGAGNGAHLHLSLADADGPLLSGGTGPRGMTGKGAAAVGGIVAGLPEVQGVLAGCVLSPLRLRPGNWAGAFACWGLENREAAVRFIAATGGNPHGASVELKSIDGSANPYLAAAALLGLALDGVERDLPLPPEVAVDPATLPQAERDRLALAGSQAAALDALDASPLARRILGDSIVDGTLAVRRYEQRTYSDADPETVAAACRLAFSC
jgi:glutamine synthetase